MVSPTSSPPSTSAGGILFFCGLLTAAVGITVALNTRSERSVVSNQLSTAVPDTVKSLHSSNTPGLDNVYRMGEKLYSGSLPDDEIAFATLSRLGIKTIISVNGIEPDIDAAHAHGMRYVHLPISYAGLPHDRLVDVVRVTNELAGPFYIHCDHGVDRAPAVAAAVWKCLNPPATTEEALAVFQTMNGRADQFPRLYHNVQAASCPTMDELKTTDSRIPEVSQVPPIARSMALIDRMWDRVARPAKIRNSTTITVQLSTAYDIAEQFREVAMLPEINDELRPGLQTIVDDLEKLAEIIKAELRNPTERAVGRDKAVEVINNRCRECHDKHRN